MQPSYFLAPQTKSFKIYNTIHVSSSALHCSFHVVLLLTSFKNADTENVLAYTAHA